MTSPGTHSNKRERKQSTCDIIALVLRAIEAGDVTGERSLPLCLLKAVKRGSSDIFLEALRFAFLLPDLPGI